MRKELKDVILRAKFGKGKKARVREWRFATYKGAKMFGKVFLLHNPLCAMYMVMGDYRSPIRKFELYKLK